MKQSRYLTAEEAANALDISLPTLYAYVSRGLIRSEAIGANKRARRYSAEDVQRLKERRESRRDPARVAETALHWGAPVLDSAITLITEGGLYYRGHDAPELALTRSVEEVAALLWTGSLEDGAPRIFDSAPSMLGEHAEQVRAHLTDLTPVEAFHVLLPLEAVEDLAAYDLRQNSVIQTGARILKLMATIAAGASECEDGIARTIQRGWVPRDERAIPLVSAALILCADHELNVSSFTARCVASAGSTLYAVVLAGLAALQGTRHGGHSERVEAFLREAQTPAVTTRQATAAYIDAGDAFDPWSAARRGVELSRLLWVRCRGRIDVAFKAADAVVRGGGARVVVLDLAGATVSRLRRMPAAAYVRLRRAVDHTPTALLVLADHPLVGTSASATIRLSRASVVWSGRHPTGRVLSDLRAAPPVVGGRGAARRAG